MKSCTDIEQSKKLLELGVTPKTADMHYILIGDMDSENIICSDICPLEVGKPYNELTLPAWSLSALLSVLPNGNMLVKTIEGGYYCLSKYSMTKHYDNPIDACYEMILKLHELNLL